MPSPNERKRIAIACQGGGSHTAFTAGVLKQILGDPRFAPYELVGLSGTSGGAICALLAWYGLADEDPHRAGELLDAFWRDNSARTPDQRMVNAWLLWAGSMQNYVAMPAVSPYLNPFAGTGLSMLRQLLTRHVDFDALPAPDGHPVLLVGAVDVLSGDFRAFDSRSDRITAETVLASAAIPTMFRSVHVDGGLYWDGLFSQNPPVRELVDTEPDEIWVIQINPTRLDAEPRSVRQIDDRRNELSGNLSLHQELRFIEKIDQLLEEGSLASDRYRHITVRVVELSRARLPGRLGPVSKLNREPAFIAELVAHGEERGREFLTALEFESAWRAADVDATLRFFASDAVLRSGPPFPAHGPARGRKAIERFLREHLTGEVDIDVTRKQVAGERVTWSARFTPSDAGDRVRAAIEADFDGDRVAALRLTAAP